MLALFMSMRGVCMYVLEYFSDIFLLQQHHLTASKATCCQHEISSFGSSSLRDLLFMRASFLSAFARTRKKLLIKSYRFSVVVDVFFFFSSFARRLFFYAFFSW